MGFSPWVGSSVVFISQSFAKTFKMEDYTLPHQVNIWVHVSAGSVALLLGILILLLRKGGQNHRKLGRWFLAFLSVVIVTGLIGFLIFKVNQFLLVLTLLSGYNAYSGYRAIRTKSNVPKIQDILIAFITLCSGLFFLYYSNAIGMIWAPVIIYSTIGFLFLTIAYDMLRYFIPQKRYGNLWFYEHIYKMTAAFTALLAAATGTMLPNYKPYSQFLPSVFGTLLAIGFILYFYRKGSLRQK